MNYPCVMANPLLQKKPTKEEQAEIHKTYHFDNMKRPVSCYQHTDNFHRPFSTKDGGETLM